MDTNATRSNAVHTDTERTDAERTDAERTDAAGTDSHVDSHIDYVGQKVVDERDRELGTVVDVAYDDGATGAGGTAELPAWLVVDPGPFRAAHWMPVAGTYRSASGRIVVPWDKELLKHSPKATDDHLMTPRLAHDIERHYEISTPP